MAKKLSQRAKVLACLKANGCITVRQAVVEMGIMSLPKRIEELRDEGYEIITDYRKSTSGARYGVYKLVEE